MLAASGVVLAWLFYLKRPDIPEAIKQRFLPLFVLLDNKYYADKFNEIVFAGGARLLGGGLWKIGDVGLIDGLMVNGSAKIVGMIGSMAGWLQRGYIYIYAFWMIVGVTLLILMSRALPGNW